MQHTLSDDRRRLSMVFEEPVGTRTITIGWDHPVTADELAYALDNAEELRTLETPNERATAWRKQTRIGTFYLHLLQGPPTWWVPKLRIKRWELGIGWLETAVTVAFRRNHR